MKTKKIILAISVAMAILLALFCGCSDAISTQTNTTQENDVVAQTPEERMRVYEERGRDDLEERKKEVGITKEDTLNSMKDKDGWWSNIVLGTAVETFGEAHGIIGEGMSVVYSFKVIENLTGAGLSEYITVSSQIGDIFELGKEYCISPTHNYNELWDTHIISDFQQVISSDMLSDSDIESIKKSIAEMGLIDYIGKVAENASLSEDFITKVDLAMVITITDKRKEELADNIFDVHYKLDEVLFLNSKYEEFLPDWLSTGELFGTRINSDVEVGGTYLIMESAKDSGTGGYFTMPAARNGAVVSVRSPDYERYRLAFLERVQ
ncbi:MAG: hypothetical protein FWH07_04735 [Oscillospiraceae bacterium]|nr:hypothetical protein [Oscillospiraceae bacterium]